jgi:hypothetical protein
MHGVAVAQVCGLGPLNASEAAGIEAMRAELLSSVKKGLDFVDARAAKLKAAQGQQHA